MSLACSERDDNVTDTKSMKLTEPRTCNVSSSNSETNTWGKMPDQELTGKDQQLTGMACV